MSKRDGHDVDIDYLYSLIDESGLPVATELREAVSMTPWAVEFRYADPFDASPLDRAEALATVVVVRGWAARTIDATRP